MAEKKPGFDPAAYFEKMFRKLEHTAASGSPELQATVTSSLLELLSTYRLKLQLGVYQERLVQSGRIIASLGDYELALSECFAPILGTAELEAKGMGAIRLRVLAEFGSVECSFALLDERDPSVAHAASTATVRELLRRVRVGMASCAKHETLYWLVLNGTRLAYSMCTRLMRPERAAEAIETLGWCALCMEGMLPLLAPRFLMWRIQLYEALCHCYEAVGMVEAAAKAATHALARYTQLKNYDKHDPVPPTAEMNARYDRAEKALGALRFKYVTCLAPPKGPSPEELAAAAAPAKGKPPAKGEVPPPPPESGLVVALKETVGEAPTAQLVAVLEALHDYTTSARTLATAPPSEAREKIVSELLAKGMELAASSLAKLTAHEEAKLALAQANEQAASAQAAATTAQAAAEAEAAAAPLAEGAPPSPVAAAAAEAQAQAQASAAALEGLQAAEAAAAAEASAATQALPLPMHVRLLCAAFKNQKWDEVSMLADER
jgi:hypothetical protein